MTINPQLVEQKVAEWNTTYDEIGCELPLDDLTPKAYESEIGHALLDLCDNDPNLALAVLITHVAGFIKQKHLNTGKHMKKSEKIKKLAEALFDVIASKLKQAGLSPEEDDYPSEKNSGLLIDRTVTYKDKILTIHRNLTLEVYNLETTQYNRYELNETDKAIEDLINAPPNI